MAIARRHKKLKVPGSLYTHAGNDRKLKEQERWSELYARRIARQTFRGIRQAAKDGTLVLGSEPLPPEVQAAMKAGIELREQEALKRHNRDWEDKHKSKRLMTCKDGILVPAITDRTSP